MEGGVSYTRLDLGTGERFQSLRRALGVTTFGMNLMLLQPGQQGRIHRHGRQEEVYLVRGELARVAPEVRRQLVNRGREQVAILALGGANPHEGRDGEAFESWQAATGTEPAAIPLPKDLPSGELRGA
jgi:mannose-6-phosphate isomerase-like protein (cupin superfamily)